MKTKLLIAIVFFPTSVCDSLETTIMHDSLSYTCHIIGLLQQIDIKQPGHVLFFLSFSIYYYL
jgi:hypothetical protein